MKQEHKEPDRLIQYLSMTFGVMGIALTFIQPGIGATLGGMLMWFIGMYGYVYWGKGR